MKIERDDLENQIKENTINAELTFTESQLVSFGEYLLSNKRRELFASHPELLDKNLDDRLSVVHHSDVYNWLQN